MKNGPSSPSGSQAQSLAGDLALIAEAVADAFRALIPSPAESRSSRLRHCGCSF